MIRVDGTTLAEWDRAEDLRVALKESLAASILLPRSIADAPRLEVTGVPSWYDSGLGGRRAMAAAHVAWGTRSDLTDNERAEPPPNARKTATRGSFIASSPDARPAFVWGTVVSGTRPDANWPTGSRADVEPMRAAIDEASTPIELDIGDVWRLDHDRLPGAARAAFTTDVLNNVVAPLVVAAVAADRPVIVASLLPPLSEQHADRWHGALAIVGLGRGLLSSDAIDGSMTERRDPGFAVNRSLPGTIDVSRVLGASGFKTLPDADRAATTDPRCTTPAPGDAIPGSGRDRSLTFAADVHDGSAAVLLLLLTGAALLACWLVAAARRAFTIRLILGVAATAMLLLPIAAAFEGAIGGSLGVRIALLASVIIPAAGLVAWLPFRVALGIAGAIGGTAGILELAGGGRNLAASILTAPLYRGIRSEGPDALLVGLTVLAIAVAVSWWADTATPRVGRATEGLAVVLAASALLARWHPPLPALLFIVTAGAIGVASLHAGRVARIVAIACVPLAVGAFAFARDPMLPLEGERFEQLTLMRFGAQPRLWPLLALLVVVLLVVRLRLSERHEDVLARASFGAPAWRTAEMTVYAIAPLAAVTMAAGTYAAALMTLLALLIGRIR